MRTLAAPASRNRIGLPRLEPNPDGSCVVVTDDATVAHGSGNGMRPAQIRISAVSMALLRPSPEVLLTAAVRPAATMAGPGTGEQYTLR